MTDVNPATEAETGAAPDEANNDLGNILEAAPVAEKPAKKAKTEAAPEAKPETQEPFWYRQAIKKEKQRAEAAERRAAELEEQRGHQPRELPNPGQDPQGFYAELNTMRLVDKLERSEDRFIDKHGEPEFEATKDWLATRPDVEEAALKQRHPWAYAHTVYQRERLAAEIGDDPNKWREAEREKLRQELEAEFAEQGYQPPAMASAHRLPTPAAGVRSTGPKGGFNGPPALNQLVGPRK